MQGNCNFTGPPIRLKLSLKKTIKCIYITGCLQVISMENGSDITSFKNIELDRTDC